MRWGSCSALENPIGIETEFMRQLKYKAEWSCSALENPIGIETLMQEILGDDFYNVAAHLKTR